MKIYREVKCSERLPSIEGWYHCMDILGRHCSYQFFNNKELDYYWKPSIIVSWLEPIEIELESEKILPKEERGLFKVCESAEDVQNYAEQLEKALNSAELKNVQLQEEVNKLQFKCNEVREMADEQINRLKVQIEIIQNDLDGRDATIEIMESKIQELEDNTDEQINKLKEQYIVCKEIADRRKEQVDLLTSYADERYNSALEIMQKGDKLVTPREFDKIINKALKIAAYGE